MHKCKMVKVYLKLINTQQAKVTHAYRNTKEKLHTTNAAIYYVSYICALVQNVFVIRLF